MYISIIYAFVGSKRLIMFVPCILDRQYIIIMHVCRHAFWGTFTSVFELLEG